MRAQFSHFLLSRRDDLELITELAPPSPVSFYLQNVTFDGVIPSCSRHGVSSANEIIRKLDVMAGGYLHPDLFDHHWQTLLATGSEGMAVALSLGLLPNLHTVTFSQQFGDQALRLNPLYHRNNSIISLLVATCTGHLRPAFTRLSKITLVEFGSGNLSLAYYAAAFLLLPSMKTCELQACLYLYDEGPRLCDDHYGTSSLIFTDSLVSAEALHDTLQAFKKLKSFSYSQGMPGAWPLMSALDPRTGYWTSKQWDAPHYRDVLLQCAQDTLEHLKLELHTYVNRKGIGSLQAFPALKTVAINEGILWSEAGKRLRIVDIFPPATQEIHITHSRLRQTALFRDLRELAPTLLPALRYVVLSTARANVIVSIRAPAEGASCFDPAGEAVEPQRRSLAEHLAVLEGEEAAATELRAVREKAREERRK